MTQIKAAQPVFETTASALREKSKLRRHFRRFDMFFYLICTVVTMLGGKTRREPGGEPAIAANTPVDHTDQAP
jgi:hypothetical protein